MKTLIIFSHTYWNDSKVNRKLLESIKDFKDITIHNLNEIYKDNKITKDNMKSEISLLKEHDKIIFQFPLFWFSTPSLLKEWQDTVLTDILYGSESKCLEGKTFQIITTAGGEKSFYDSLEFGINTLLSPINTAFKYLGLKIENPLCIYQANTESLNLNEYHQYLE